MSQRKYSSLKRALSNNDRSKTWILILHSTEELVISDGFLNINNGKVWTPEMVKLRHPRSGGSAMFLFSYNDSIIQEVFSLSEKRSWFINDSVRENGNIHFSTPIDPLLLVLPYLKKSKEKKKIVPLEDLLIDESFPETLRILKLLNINNMHMLADRKGSEDLNAWMYNEQKTMKWLCRKTEKVVKVLQEKQINVKGTSVNFVKSISKGFSNSEMEILDRESYLKCAHGLVSEYLSDDLSRKLLSSLGFPKVSPGKIKLTKRKCNSAEEQENVKKAKMEIEETFRSFTKKEEAKCLSVKEKAVLKAVYGSESITSFFKKK